jgi:hypothetical protein
VLGASAFSLSLTKFAFLRGEDSVLFFHLLSLGMAYFFRKKMAKRRV